MEEELWSTPKDLRTLMFHTDPSFPESPYYFTVQDGARVIFISPLEVSQEECFSTGLVFLDSLHDKDPIRTPDDKRWTHL